MRVGLFVPCFIDALYPEVGVATVRLLEHLGIAVDYPQQQTCCGQPHFNAGQWPDAGKLAERFCELFSDYDTVVCPSGSCTSMVRSHYATLVPNATVAERVFELCEFLVDRVGVTKLGAQLSGSAAVHVGCHGLRDLGLSPAVSQLLAEVQGLQLTELASDSWCCGFGGTFSVKFPEVSVAMGTRKLEPALRADVDYVISTDSSCLMQLGGILAHRKLERPRLLHIAEVLATCTEAI